MIEVTIGKNNEYVAVAFAHAQLVNFAIAEKSPDVAANPFVVGDGIGVYLRQIVLKA